MPKYGNTSESPRINVYLGFLEPGLDSRLDVGQGLLDEVLLVQHPINRSEASRGKVIRNSYLGNIGEEGGNAVCLRYYNNINKQLFVSRKNVQLTK